MGLSSDQLVFVPLFSGFVFFAFLTLYFWVLGARRWKYTRKTIDISTEQGAELILLSKLASDDRKEMLLVLREIKTLLEDRKS